MFQDKMAPEEQEWNGRASANIDMKRSDCAKGSTKVALVKLTWKDNLTVDCLK